jgi:hypothetical protein
VPSTRGDEAGALQKAREAQAAGAPGVSSATEFVEGEIIQQARDRIARLMEAGKTASANAAAQSLARRFRKLNSEEELAGTRVPSSEGRTEFLKYFKKPTHKAFAIGDHSWGWSAEYATAQEATDDALKQCQVAEKAACKLYAVDSRILSQR